jgi:hypothetical protein
MRLRQRTSRSAFRRGQTVTDKPARLQQIKIKKKRHLIDRDDIASKCNEDFVRFDLALEAQPFCSLNTLGRYMQRNWSIPQPRSGQPFSCDELLIFQGLRPYDKGFFGQTDVGRVLDNQFSTRVVQTPQQVDLFSIRTRPHFPKCDAVYLSPVGAPLNLRW